MENMERLNGKTVLLTGATGLVGGHLTEKLIGKYANVIVPYRSRNAKSYFEMKKFQNKTIMINCDVTDSRQLFNIVTHYDVDYIIHLAAQALVSTAYYDPSETLLTNIMGTVGILECARKYPRIKGIIVASSDKAYGKSDKPYTEDMALHGDHPYEVSKSAADLIANTYAKTYGLPIVITRFGNIYGPGDLNFNRIIPGIMKSVIEKEELEIRSNGKYVRDYVYVKDVADAYIFLLERIIRIKGEAFNISSGVSYSVMDLIKNIDKILHKSLKYKILNTAINEIPSQHLNYGKITKLGWTPKSKFSESIRETYEWYKSIFKNQ
jgi:CDP-glucose 4,6-dehydratase